ncbi:hypothetical protein C5167_043527 [Papaver somniferum]|uniref:Large ribosomal subunit protein bL12 C-terminal domain-containing protein n=1 Tax=Papaver somniferum TaxID=3469 RepID=A0A4Y7L9V2_PAPSO|nr:uncharacterized protein LOC113319072 [Papaver somniferum]RZC80945.1 hypothetical protein C5167_043527 [Papaver somniferum]
MRKIPSETLITNLIYSSSRTRILHHLSLSTATASSTTTETQSQKLERIADQLIDLTKFEKHDYGILFRHKSGLNKYGPAISGLNASAGGGGGGGSTAAAAAEVVEKVAFDLKLEKFDAASKIKIIKEVRSFTDLGLKEAKDLVEKAPVMLKKGLTKEEANPILEKLKELGATVVLE